MRITRTSAYGIALSIGGTIGAFFGYKLQSLFLPAHYWGWRMAMIIAVSLIGVGVVYVWLADMFGEPLIDKPLTKGEVRKAIEQRKALAEERNIAEAVKGIVSRFGKDGSYTQHEVNCAIGGGAVVVRIYDRSDSGWRTVFKASLVSGTTEFFEDVILAPDEEGLILRKRISSMKIPDRYEIEIYVPGDWEGELRYLSEWGRRPSSAPSSAQRKAEREAEREASKEYDRKAREKLQDERSKFGV